MVSRFLVDNGSRADIFFKDAAEMIRILDIINKSKATHHTFSGSLIRSLGMVKKMVQAEPYNYLVFFHIMDLLNPAQRHTRKKTSFIR